MQLPNAGRAVVDIAKLPDYLLSTTQPRGRHKARIFSASSGPKVADAAELHEAVLRIDATEMDSGEFGLSFVVDFTLSHHGRTDEIQIKRTVGRGEDFPQLTSWQAVFAFAAEVLKDEDYVAHAKAAA